jgi:uncharacterized protein
MKHEHYQADVVIAGAGLAGLVAAHELLTAGQRVLLIDKDKRENLGGLARESAGGVFLVDTPYQRRLRIKDSAELAWRDWQSVAFYEPDDAWPRQWGEFFCHNSRELVFDFLHDNGVRFLPVVQWPERGIYSPGNTVPRWHITWGLGEALVLRVIAALESHPHGKNLELLFDKEVSDVDVADGRVTGVHGVSTDGTREFQADAPVVVIAAGGICGGDLSKLRAHWYKPWGKPPEVLLNGAHKFGDGMLHDRVAELGGALTHLDLQWHYPSGVHNPKKRRPNDGLSLVPPRSALWFNAVGERIQTPGPMASNGDTRHLVASVLAQPGQYSWQVLNWTIARRELSVLSAEYLTAIYRKSWLRLAANQVFPTGADAKRLMHDCAEDIVVADSLDQLMDRMDAKQLYGLRLDRVRMQQTIQAWDAMIERGPAFHNDEQLRRIASVRAYRGDRIRTCKFQSILDPKARPLIAVREFIMTRKSLGGIQTDLQCRVLRTDGNAIPGLYAVGEAAGFGGGGMHGRGSLEGTFLAGCVFTGRVAGRGIAGSSTATPQPTRGYVTAAGATARD